MWRLSDYTTAISLVAGLLGVGGCYAPYCLGPDLCGTNVEPCPDFGAIDRQCGCPGYYAGEYDERCNCEFCAEQDREQFGHPDGPRSAGGHRVGHRIERGPPPVVYRPPLPPKFLPVPARSVFSKVNVLAPTPTRGNVEIDYGSATYGPQLTVPGRD